MKRLCMILLFFLSCYCYCVTAQTFSSEEKRKTSENILNTVINSTFFDSVYNYKTVYFMANELLTENSSLVLKRNNCKVKILNKDKVGKVKQYAVLGDFTLDWNNIDLSFVRVQIEIMPERTLLNLSLIKENGIWIIRNHIIFED